MFVVFFFFKQKTAYEMRISDWSSDVCSSDLMATDVQAAVDVPLLHIADPTAERIKAAGFSKVGLLGTAFTMEHAFYKGRLADQHGLSVIIPNDEDRATVHRIIYAELVAEIGRASCRERVCQSVYN